MLRTHFRFTSAKGAAFLANTFWPAQILRRLLASLSCIMLILSLSLR